MPPNRITSSTYPSRLRHFNCVVCSENSERFVSRGTYPLCSFILLYPLLKLKSCWTLTFGSLQVINVLYRARLAKIAASSHLRPCRLTSLEIQPGSHPPILQTIAFWRSVVEKPCPEDTRLQTLRLNQPSSRHPLCTCPRESSRAPEETRISSLTSGKLSYCMQHLSIE